MALSMMLATPPPTPAAALSSARLRRSARPPRTSIRSSSEGAGETGPARLDRRNVLLGLGGLYGAATTLTGKDSATAEPVVPPELTACHTANYPDGFGDNAVPVYCCPPYDVNQVVNIEPYQFPQNAPLRVRKPAHLLTQWEKDRFKRAVADMKNNYDSRKDPWHFMQQAQIHCAYCNEAYNQKGRNVSLQVHFSWLFVPWHRFYLYFFEKILGEIIDDRTFALPFWNYDVREGMGIPDIYTDVSSSLYNPNRNGSHLKQLMDLNYSYDIEDKPPKATVAQDNIDFMRKMFRDDTTNPFLFLGSKVSAGDKPDANLMSGALENMHNVVHSWTGSVEPPNLDMGNFFSAARDMLFYGHHANVDRLWSMYRQLKGNRREFEDRDWLNASFVFYSEGRKIVSVKVEDCLNTMNMGYVYQDVPVEYLSPPAVAAPRVPSSSGTPSLIRVSDFGPSPRPLTETIRAVVKRPKASRTAAEKQKEVEVLVVDGIAINDPEPIRFDVFVNKVIQGSFVTGLGQFAGSFTRLRHNHRHNGDEPTVTGLRLGITGVVEAAGADGDESLVVTLVPRNGQVTLAGVRTELMKTDA